MTLYSYIRDNDLTIAEAARSLGISRTTLYKYLVDKQGKYHSVDLKEGKYWYKVNYLFILISN